MEPTKTRLKLKKISLKGFKSISNETEQTIPLGDISILLGANGSGKSNIVSFFKMLNYMMTGGLQNYVAKYSPQQLLFYGPQKTESISFSLHFASDNESTVSDTYEVRLSWGMPNRLFVSGEKVTYRDNRHNEPEERSFDPGHGEIQLREGGKSDPTNRVVYALLAGIRTYQFHDSSEVAKVRDQGYMDDCKYLRSDAGNLAAFLKMLKEKPEYAPYYRRIVNHIHIVMPQFGDFSLESIPSNENYTRLNWTDSVGSDYLFGPHQLSDGSLRFMALATLLLQPPDILPRVIVIDEPELGLHPAAIAQLAGMIHIASQNAQILFATQSTRLLDEFPLRNLVIVEHESQSSTFRNLSEEKLAEWLDAYSLSELWEKNVLGGQP